MTVQGLAAGVARRPQTITLDDVLVGDVWVASGQSNMEFAMRQAATAGDDLPHAEDPHIRLLMVKKRADYATGCRDGWMDGVEPGDGEGFLRGGMVFCAGD